MLALYIFIIYMPFAALFFLYSVILYKLKSQKHPGERSVLRWETNRKVATMTIAIVVSNALCFTPIGIKNLLEIFTWITYHPRRISVYVFQKLSPFMAQAYCAINAWLCFIFSVKYRQGLKKLLKQSLVKLTVLNNVFKNEAFL